MRDYYSCGAYENFKFKATLIDGRVVEGFARANETINFPAPFYKIECSSLNFLNVSPPMEVSWNEKSSEKT